MDYRPIRTLLRHYQVCAFFFDRSAEMGAQLRGAQDVEVGVPGSSGADQAERPNNVGYSRPCGSAMGDSGVLGCPCSPHPQSLALAACGGKVVCSGCSAWQIGTFPAPLVLQPPHEVHVTLRLPRIRSGKALGVVFGPRAPGGTTWCRWVQRTAPIWGNNVLVSAVLGLYPMYV